MNYLYEQRLIKARQKILECAQGFSSLSFSANPNIKTRSFS